MTPVPDLVILGGGIAGLTSALVAAGRGMRVTVLDHARPGSASRASAGLLAPSIAGLPDGVRPVALAARDAYPRFLAMLLDATDITVSLDRQGILEVASSEDDLAQRSARAGPGADTLDARVLASLEPALAAHPGAVLHPGDGAVDNVTLMAALDVAVARHSRIARLTDEVGSLDAKGNLPAFLSRGGTRYAGRRLLLAGGAWAGALPGLPRAIPVRPVCGQLLRLEGPPIRHATHTPQGYLVPRRGTMIVGATHEETGFDCATTARGLAALRAIAAHAVPVLAHATAVDHWAGLRPVTPDGLPILGTDPAFPALSYACGFSRNGILLAPWAAEQLASTMTGGGDAASLAPFRMDRFQTPA